MAPEDNPADEIDRDREKLDDLIRFARGRIEHWDGHDKHRVTEADRAMLGPDGEPSDITIMRGWLFLLTSHCPANEAKYGMVTASKKKFHHGEPVFLLRATDALAPMLVSYYRNHCILNGCSDQHTRSLGPAQRAIEKWQREHPELVKLPD